MRRIPLFLVAAVVLASVAVAVMYIRVVSVGVFAPPVASTPHAVVVPAGAPVVYFYSATSAVVTSNVTADFRLATLLGTPYVALSAPLPPDVKVTIQYTDPITNTAYTFTLVNRSTTRKVYYVLSGSPTGCTNYGNIGTVDSLVGTARATAVVARTAEGVIVLYPNLTEVGYITVDRSRLVVYRPDGSKWIECNWHRTYANTTAYTLATGNAVYNFVFGDRNLVVAVRPLIVGAVWPSADAKVELSLS